MTSRPILPRWQFSDANGNPLAGGKLHWHESGTSSPITTYSDAARTVANTNPIILDASGWAGDIFLPPGDAKLTLADAADVPLWTADPVSANDILGQVANTVRAANYTVTPGDHGTVFEGTGSWTLTLPALAIAGSGFFVRLENVGAGLIVIDGDGAETIDGQTTIVVPPGFGATVRAYVGEWRSSDFPTERLIVSQVTGGSTGIVDFTLPSPDLLYRLRYTNLAPVNAELLLLRWSIDGGTSFLAGATDYHRSGIYNGAATATGFGDLGGTAITLTTSPPAGGVFNGICEFHPGTATAPAALLTAQAGLTESGGTYLRTVTVHGRRSADGVVNAVRLAVSTGDFAAGGRVSLYGIRP